MVINETLARRMWAGRDAVGQQMRLSGREGVMEIIGVARDSKYRTLGEEATPFVYQAFLQNYERDAHLLVRSRSGGEGTAALVAEVRREIRAIEPNLPVFQAERLKDRLGVALLFPQLGAALFGSFGMLGLLLASRAAPVEALKEEAGGIVGGRRGWLRSTLVVVQVALSVVLLVAAGLFVRSLNKAQAFEPGFNPKRVVLASVSLFPNRYNPQTGREFLEKAFMRLEAEAGVKSATVGRRIPLGFGGTSSTTIQVEGYTPRTRDEQVWGMYNQVGPRYFETMQIPLVKGRDFTTEDKKDKPLVMAINEEMARRYWSGRDPIGQKVNLFGVSVTVVGVVKNTKMRELKEAPAPFFYLPVDQFYTGDLTFHVRTEGEPSAVAGAVRKTLQEMDAELAIFNLTTLEEYIGAATFQQKLAGTFLAAFGVLALVLAAVGIFGVMAYAVSQRTHEIGVRMALGAKPGDVFRLVLRQGMMLLGIGVLIGVAGAALASRALTKLLFEVSPLDPVTFAAVPVVLGVVALVACWVPAMRATRVDPVVALRYE